MTSRAPLFFVVSGAHGVGKTTAIEACQTLLADRGVPVRQFHHIVDVVPAKAAPTVSASETSSKTVRSSSWWRRAIPYPVKMLVSSALDASRYRRGINLILAQAAADGQIALSDRFVYDRVVDLRLRGRPLVQRAAVRILCNFMRRPTLTILLTDTPAAIFQRKQELTEAEIAEYQHDLAALCQRIGARHVLLPVDGREPKAVARAVVSIILDKAAECGHAIPSPTSVSDPAESHAGAGMFVADEN